MNIKIKLIAALFLAVFVLPGVSFAHAMSSAQLQQEIQSLMAEVQSLESRLAAQGGSGTSWCYNFDGNLSVGASGAAVTALQTALQEDGEQVTVNGTFDDQTAAAVTGFQEKYATQILVPYGLSNGTGYVGAATRAELNSLFGCGTIPLQSVGPGPVQSTTVPLSSSMSDYQNSQYGIQFGYPASYTVKYGAAAFGTSDNPMGDYGIGMENPDLTPLVTIEMPSNSYPNTDFEGAYLNVSVDTQMNSGQCAAMNTGSSPSKGTKMIGGVSFNWSTTGSAAAGTDFTNGSFSGYANGICYVLLAGGVEGSGGIGSTASNGAVIAAVDQSSVLAALNNVLATMVFSEPAASSTGGNPKPMPSQAILPVTANPDFVSGSLAVGQANQQVGSYVISNPSSKSINLTSLTVQPGANASWFHNFRVMVRGYAESYSHYGAVSDAPVIFPGMSVDIGANSTVTVDLYADVASAASAGLENMTAVTGCTATGQVTSPISLYTCSSANGQTMTFTTDGGWVSSQTTLSNAINSAFPSESTIAGAESQKVASYIVDAPSFEPVTLSQINLTLQGSPSDFVGLIASFNPQLAASTYGHGGTYGLVSNGEGSYQATLPAQFNATIPAAGSMTIDIYATNINSSSTAGSQVVSSLNCIGKGATSNALYQSASAQGQTITIAQVSNPTLSTLDTLKDPSSPAGNILSGSTQETLGVFDLTATGGESVNILSLPVVFGINGTNVTGGEVTNVRLMEGNAQIGRTIPSLISGNTNSAIGNGVYDATFGIPGSPLNFVIPGNTTSKISIVGDISKSASGDSISAGIGGGFLGNAVDATYNLNVPLGDVGANTVYPVAAAL